MTTYQRVEVVSADGLTGPVDEEQSEDALHNLQTQDQSYDSIHELKNKQAQAQKQLFCLLQMFSSSRCSVQYLIAWVIAKLHHADGKHHERPEEADDVQRERQLRLKSGVGN